MIPIEKNINVVDEQGNKYEATYPTRAKGLVKNGRARFVSDNTICLACPPNINLEDYIMSDNKEIKEETTEISHEMINNKTESADGTKNDTYEAKYSINYVLEQIEKIAFKNEYLDQVISELRQMDTGGAGDIGNANKAEALSDVVKCRETTNQQLLRFYEKMYDDLKPQRQSFREKALEAAQIAVDNGCIEEFSNLIDTLKHTSD